MKIKFFGVRGSFAVPGPDTSRYGGNTTAVSIYKEVDNRLYRLNIDGGTGVINLGKEIVANYFQKKEEMKLNIFFTHLHPDHTQGFPFFAPNYFKDCHISLFGMKTLKKHVGMVLEQEMLPPTFPIEYKDLKSTRKHYQLKDQDVLYLMKDYKFVENPKKEEDIVFKIDIMQAFAPSHPQQGSIYYKITDCETQKSVACIWDLESHAGGDRRVIQFSKGVDVMIHDTQYTSDEYNSTDMVVQGFGHSSYEMAIENAVQSDIKKALLCIHYNPSHSDDKLDSIHKELSKKEYDFDIVMSYEGLEYEV